MLNLLNYSRDISRGKSQQGSETFSSGIFGETTTKKKKEFEFFLEARSGREGTLQWDYGSWRKQRQMTKGIINGNQTR